MTGQIAFARTIRALDADDSRGSKLVLLIAIAVLALWTWWFLTPSIQNFSALAENASLQWSGPHKVALRHNRFPHIRGGQAARLRFDGHTIIARVVYFGFFVTGSETHLVILEVPSTIQPPLPSRATIEVETDRISPATLVLNVLSR
jgi:hypothetical protein